MTIDLSTYVGLQAAVVEISERTGDTAFTNNVPSAVVRGEALLNRRIPALETDTTLTGTINSRRISLSSLSIVQPIALFLARTGYDEVEIEPQADGTFPYRNASDVPTFWSIDGTNIDFDCPLLEAYPFRFRYRQKLALATTSPNWLLTNHPDVYLAATMVNAFNDQEDVPNLARWKGILEEAIPEIQHVIAQANRGTLRVDPALLMGNRSAYNIALG